MNTDTVLERIEQPVAENEVPPTLHLLCTFCKELACQPGRFARPGTTKKHTSDEPEDCVVCHEMWNAWILAHLRTCSKYQDSLKKEDA